MNSENTDKVPDHKPKKRPQGPVYRLSKAEFESMMQDFKRSGQWMKKQLEVDPDLKHL